jgi:hypothetical protein
MLLMRRLSIALWVLVSLLMFTPAGLAVMRQPFEGTQWKIVVTPEEDARQAGAREYKDTLVFKGGKFTAEQQVKEGFEPVEYDEHTTGGPTASFTAEPRSEEQGTARWRGTITASEMRGEMAWTREDGSVLNYTFRGERVSR